MKVLLLIVLILSVVCAEKKRYNGYTVLRMQINSTNYDPITDIVEQYHLDVWQTNAIEQWMDIMIPPNQEVLDVITKHNHFVKIADVEEHIQNIDEYTFHNASLKRQVFFDYFPNWEQILEWLNTQVELHSDIASLFTVGHTYLGEPIIGIKIANGGPPKRSVILQAGIHAREWITVTSALYTIQELLASPPVLNQLDFYIVPVFNIDGYSYTHSNERLWRKSREPNTGSTCIGTDLNRNYAYQWGGSGASASPCAETYRGAYADSSPELTDMTEWMSTIPNPIFYLDIHCCGAMFMSAWGYTYTLPPTQEYAQMMAAMEVARSSLRIAPNNNAYSIGSIANVIYIASGNSVDYTYTKFNLPTSFTIEVAGSGGFVRPITDILPYGREIYSGIYGVSAYLVSTLNK